MEESKTPEELIKALSDEDLDKSAKLHTVERRRRARKENPYTRVCVKCGLQMTEKEYTEWDQCTCGSKSAVKMKEREPDE